MNSIKRLLDSKGYDVWSIEPAASVFSAIEMMADKEIGALPVLDGSELVGIISERDYARKVILEGRSSKQTAVRDVMTTTVLSTTPEQTINDCMALMTDNRIRHLPVLEAGRVIGMVSIGDLVKVILAEKELLIEQLEQYISG